MAAATRQTQSNSGGNNTVSEQTSKNLSKSTKNSAAIENRSETTAAPVKTTTETKGAKSTSKTEEARSTTTSQSDATPETSSEDIGFVLNFSITLKTPIPCEEQP
jgi:hypothetical protein